MKRLMMAVMMVVSAVLLVGTGCGSSKPVSHFVVRAADGQTMSEADTDKLRAVLDAFAAARKMPKVKPGEAGIIRYYKPNADFSIGFYAQRGTGCILVYANPMTPGVTYLDSYTQFRQELANTLAQSFPGRVALSSK